MSLSPFAGKPAPTESLIDVDSLIGKYYDVHAEPGNPAQRVAFGTSGHRGTSTNGTFNEDHILAITQAIVEYRTAQGVTGPLFLGKDSHALSEPAQRTALEVLAATGVEVCYTEGYTPTPAISHAILTHNRAHIADGDLRHAGCADGIVITPSHNPPGDGGFKYNPPHGGPADASATGWIENRANALLREGANAIRRADFRLADSVRRHDFVMPYVRDLGSVIDMPIIHASGLRIGADPMGGASVDYWQPIAEIYGLDITVVNPTVDKTFRFMSLDHDGKIRMDCSSPYAMASLVAMKDKFDIAFGSDTDADRHGIVTPGVGLMNPNHYLSAAIAYLFRNRPGWRPDSQIGKTLVSSSMIDRVAGMIGRQVCEVPVGFKWFVDGLLDGSFGFGGEESAGASFLRLDGTVWTTDKDGIILGLLAAEIMACSGNDPGAHYRDLEFHLGSPVYTRLDVAASAAEKAVLKRLSPDTVTASTLAGEPITARLTRAPGNDVEIGGLKVVTDNGWFAARPSGTEDIYKVYAESFLGREHLLQIVDEAKGIVASALSA